MAPKDGARMTSKALAPVDLVALFALAAHLIDADGDERRDQREARHQREQQREGAAAEHHASQHQAGGGIKQTEEHDVAARGAEIGNALAQRVPHIGDRDAADRRRRDVVRTAHCMAGDLDGGCGVSYLVVAPFDGIADR